MVELDDRDKLEQLAPDMQLASILACTELRNENKKYYPNNYIVGVQFTYGTYDADGKLSNSVPFYVHGKTSGECKIVMFMPEEYLKNIEIAVDDSAKTINRFIITKMSRTDPT